MRWSFIGEWLYWPLVSQCSVLRMQLFLLYTSLNLRCFFWRYAKFRRYYVVNVMNYVPELFACTRFFSFMFWLKLNIQALLDICVFLLTSHSYNWSCLLNEGFFLYRSIIRGYSVGQFKFPSIFFKYCKWFKSTLFRKKFKRFKFCLIHFKH